MSQGSKFITDIAKDTFILFLREFFSTQDIYTYHDNDDTTDIFIHDKNTINLEIQEFRPTIAVGRGPIRFRNSSIGQMANFNFFTGKKTYTDIADCEIRCECYSREGLEAEHLANLVAYAVQWTKDSIQKHYKIMVLKVVSIGEEQTIKRDSKYDLVVVPVSITMVKQMTWGSTPKSPKLRDILVTGEPTLENIQS